MPESLHHPYWARARAVLDVPVAGAVSVDPEATRARVQGLLAYGGVFWLAYQLCGARTRARQALLALALAGLAYATYGLYRQFAGSGPVTSTFVNRNSYATYAGLTLFSALGLVVRRFACYAQDDVPAGRALVRMLSQLDLTTAAALLSFLACSMALLLTQSRGAFIAVAIAFAFYLWLLRSAAILRSKAIYASFVVVLLATAAGLVRYSGTETMQRMEQAGANFQDRLTYYATTWQAIGDRPLLGTGYGTYALAFKAYNRPETGTYFLDKAHSTYLQLVFELGWPAALALFASMGCLVARCWQGLRGRDGLYPTTVLACSVLVGLQALVDFSLEMPANALTYALLLGLGCARACRQGQKPAADAAGGARPGHFARMTPRMTSRSCDLTAGASPSAARMTSGKPGSSASSVSWPGASCQSSRL
jgi:O-antigen ligase